MKKIIIILSAFFLFNGCVTHKSKDLIIQVKILNALNLDRFKDQEGILYSTEIDLINKTDTTISFWTKSCNWEVNWISNSDKLYLFNPGCDSNYPYVIHLESGKKITFKGIVRLLESTENTSDSKYRLGFVLVRENEVKDELDFKKVLKSKGEKGIDLIWSEPFKIDK